MNNAEKFKLLFDIYATELWSMSEADFLKWLNEDVPDANVCDTISRQAAIDALDTGLWGVEWDKALATAMLKYLPSAQPERLTDDDFETIRIHLNAFKENLCNQQRWKEAEEYERIIDRFMGFASAQPERKTGKWIKVGDNCYECSNCKELQCCNDNFCPNCGADMRGEEDG